ncbi:MAG: enoyl-CoA hydratase-related protein [Actinomycetota bacterium]
MGVRVERHDAIVVLTIDRPEVHNAVDAETAQGLEDAVRAFDADPESRVLVLAGAGDRAFCAGADLKAAGGLTMRPGARESGPMGTSRLAGSKPTIAAIGGYCYAGGLELACWCDIRVADETSTFGVLNRRWGVPLIDGGTQRLPRIVGLGNALYLIETGARIDAPTALRMGLVQEVVPAGTHRERALELAGHMAGYPQSSLLADRASALLLDGIEAEAKRGEATLADPEMLAGLERFRLHDRPSPPSAPPGDTA